MKKIIDLFNKIKKPIIWTACYTLVMWAILYFMFNFDMFNSLQWHRLLNSQLRGFPGFVFGILILSAIPLYVATTVIVARKNEYLVSLPKFKLPKIIKQPTSPQKQPETKAESTPANEPDLPKISDDVPYEMRSIYLRALRNFESIQFNTPDTTESNAPNTPDTPEPESLPLPSDFDISFSDVPGYDADKDSNIPVFTDISFNTPEETNDNQPEYSFDNSKIIEHLKNSGRNYKINNNIVITDKYSIITHNDNDFWVTDADTWFATGKSCPSPAKIVKSASEQNGTIPVLYLASTNIMDLETLIPQWESEGIIVITDINKL